MFTLQYVYVGIHLPFPNSYVLYHVKREWEDEYDSRSLITTDSGL